MQILEQSEVLRKRQRFAIAAIGLWLVVLSFVSGPARWEFQHSYAHWIEGATDDLPILTSAFALPVLGIGQPGLATLLVQCVFWGSIWLPPLVVFVFVLRSESRQSLVELLLLSCVGYVAALALLTAVAIVGFWLPFSLL